MKHANLDPNAGNFKVG